MAVNLDGFTQLPIIAIFSKKVCIWLHLEQGQAEVLLLSGYNFETWSKDSQNNQEMTPDS